MSFGWAYVSCEGTTGGGGQAAGPTGSLQFLTGTNATSGSANLVYHTAAIAPYSANTLVMTGTLVVKGTVSASHYHIQNVVEMDVSGNTFFGNTNDDQHSRTGSFTLTNVGGDINFNVHAAAGRTTLKQLAVGYTAVTASGYTASHPIYILGVQCAGQVNLQLPRPDSTALSGNIILVKDELTTSRGGDNITLNVAAGKLIDGAATYVLTGTMPAISLYSNGANWFVF